MTKAFCESVDIPFIEEALTWEPGGDPSAHSWQGMAARSTPIWQNQPVLPTAAQIC